MAYLLDGKRVSKVENVGIPLDAQGVRFSGIYASLGPGELLRKQINSVTIAHGLFSLLDAFPFQRRGGVSRISQGGLSKPRGPCSLTPNSSLQLLAQGGRDAGAEHFDGAHEFRMRQRGCIHLEGDAGDAA